MNPVYCTLQVTGYLAGLGFGGTVVTVTARSIASCALLPSSARTAALSSALLPAKPGKLLAIAASCASSPAAMPSTTLALPASSCAPPPPPAAGDEEEDKPSVSGLLLSRSGCLSFLGVNPICCAEGGPPTPPPAVESIDVPNKLAMLPRTPPRDGVERTHAHTHAHTHTHTHIHACACMHAGVRALAGA